MRYIGADSETIPFSSGDMAPELVCVQYQVLGSEERHVVTRVRGAVDLIRGWLTDPECTVVLHNAAYDAAVWCAAGLTKEVFQAYREGRVLCTHTYERLGEVAGFSTRKRLDLATTCEAHGIPAPSGKGTELAREFGQFLHSAEIPEPWRGYALDDCIVTKLFARQHSRYHKAVPMRALQLLSYRQFCLQLSAVYGLRVDARAVDALQETARRMLAELIPAAAEAGIIRWDKATRKGVRQMAWVKNVKALQDMVAEAYDGNPPMTEKPRKASEKWTPSVSTSRVTLLESGDPDLKVFADYGQWASVDSKDVPMLRAAGDGGIIHTRYNIADTLRTTSGGKGSVAIQNWKTGINAKPGEVVPQIRECVVPSPGMAIISVDFAGLELASFAQNAITQLGDYRMAEDLNSVVDLHSRVGAMLMPSQPSYDTFKKRKNEAEFYWWRQAGKGSNFGFQGGMSNPIKFARYCKMQYQVPLTPAQAIAARAAWKESNPTGPAWLQHVSNSARIDGTYDAYLPGFGVTRKGVWYSAAANNPFQELGAFVCSEATIALTEAMYLPGGALTYARIIAHIHDEWLIEVPVEMVVEADRTIRGILSRIAGQTLPDVRSCIPEAKAMDRWSKRAKELRTPEGDLLVWREAA
jgi:hypothetical protein